MTNPDETTHAALAAVIKEVWAGPLLANDGVVLWLMRVAGQPTIASRFLGGNRTWFSKLELPTGEDRGELIRAIDHQLQAHIALMRFPYALMPPHDNSTLG